MAKRDNGTKRTNVGTPTTNAAGAATGDAIEQRVVAFAEQLGRIAGTFQAKAEGRMDRESVATTRVRCWPLVSREMGRGSLQWLQRCVTRDGYTLVTHGLHPA